MLGTGQVFSVGQKNGGCVVTFDNTFSDYAYTYNFTSLAGMVELLTSECIIGKNANVGLCEFEDNQPENPYVVFVVPFLFCSRMKLNQLSPLV